MAKYCVKCGKPLNDGDLFCGNCGVKTNELTPAPPQSSFEFEKTESLIELEKTDPEEAEKVKKALAEIVPMLSYAVQGKNELEAIMQARRKACSAWNKKASYVYWPLAALAMGVFAGWTIHHAAIGDLTFAGFAIYLAGFIFLLSLGAKAAFQIPSRALSKSTYYSLQGANDERGRHRCVFCGGYGIHKRTPYQTQLVINECSKCSAYLFTE